MKGNEKISIIIPAYNIEKYIMNAVNSALKQTYENVEVVVVNDGSTDNTKQLLDSLALKDARIRVIHKVNEGVTSARLTGVSVATGEWIGFLDGDDKIDSDMYERLLNNAYKYRAQLSHCGYQMVFPNRVDYYYDTGQVVLQENEKGLKDLLEGKFVEPGLCNKLYHKNLFQRLLCEDLMDMSIKNNEDLLMNYYLFKESKFSVYEDWCPYHYVLRQGSATTSKANRHKLEDPLKVLKTIRGDLQQYELISIIDSRILMTLVNMATMPHKGQEKFIREYKVWARKELKIFWNSIDKSAIGQRVLILSKGAAWCPWLYAIVHKVYAILKGTYKKYEIQ